MTDTRLPAKWLTDPLINGLTPLAWRTFTDSLMWSNEHGTDGDVPEVAFRYLGPKGLEQAPKAELIGKGLWAEGKQGGVIVLNWQGIGQSTAAEVEANKDKARKRQADYRERTKGVTRDVTHNVTRDVTHHVTRRVGQEGQDRKDRKDRLNIDTTKTSFETKKQPPQPPVDNWPTVTIPGKPDHVMSNSGVGDNEPF